MSFVTMNLSKSASMILEHATTTGGGNGTIAAYGFVHAPPSSLARREAGREEFRAGRPSGERLLENHARYAR
jgi:hypothetical protein